MDKQVCKSCHWGRALVAGMSVGLAAGLFFHTEKGEHLSADAQEAVKQLQKELMTKWTETEHFTQKEYQSMVKETIAHYRRTKKLLDGDLADAEAFLMDQWETLQHDLLA